MTLLVFLLLTIMSRLFLLVTLWMPNRLLLPIFLTTSCFLKLLNVIVQRVLCDVLDEAKGYAFHVCFFVFRHLILRHFPHISCFDLRVVLLCTGSSERHGSFIYRNLKSTRTSRLSTNIVLKKCRLHYTMLLIT